MPDDKPGDQRPPDAVPGHRAQPSNQPIDEMVVSEPLDLSDAPDDEVIEQQNVGPGNRLGGGEWPDPGTAPSDAAPGSAARGPEPIAGPSPPDASPPDASQFKAAIDEEREEQLRQRP